MAEHNRNHPLLGDERWYAHKERVAALEAEVAQMREDHSDLTEMFNRNLAEVERLREARLLALAELTGLDNANLDEHERACLRSAVRVLAS